MQKMSVGEKDKLVVLLYSQLATEENPDFEILLSILVQAKNTIKCIRFSYNLVTKNYGQNNLSWFIINSVQILDSLFADRVLEPGMMIPLIEMLFKGLFFDSCKDRANAILENICREIKEEQFTIAIEKEFVSNQNLWMLANDWIQSFRQQMMLETDNFGISQANKFGHLVGTNSQDVGDQIVDYDEDVKKQTEQEGQDRFANSPLEGSEQEGEDYFDRKIQAQGHLKGLNDSDDWKIQNYGSEDNFDQNGRTKQENQVKSQEQQILTENRYYLSGGDNVRKFSKVVGKSQSLAIYLRRSNF